MQVEGRFHRPNTLGRISVRGSKRVIVLTSPDTADEPGWRALGARTVSQAEAFARLHDVPDATSLYEEADLRAPRKKRVHFDADDADINENQEAADEHWRVLGVLSIVQSIRTRSSIQHQVTGIKASYIGGSSTRVEGANPGLQVAEFYFGDCDRREGFDQEPAHLLSDEVPVLGRRQDARLTTLNIARQRGAELRQHAPQDVAEREEAIARVQEEQEYCERFEGLREADLEYIWK